MYPWGDNRRFNSYVNYFKKKFGGRIQKLSINAGFTCPNRDGSIGIGGCTFCNNDAFNPSYCQPELPVTKQLDEGILFHKNRYKKPKGYLAYFQAYSNTYDTLENIKKKYEEALKYDGVIGLVIGTRPDCINDEKLDYFKKLSEKTYLIIEYGVESCFDKTLEKINRGHNFATSVKAIKKTAAMGINTGAHIIFGLPDETKDEMLNEAEILSRLPLSNIKFHQLQIIKDTRLAKDFETHPELFKLFEFEEYIEFMVSFTERLNPAFVIERIAGEAPPYTNISPIKWGLRNDQILNKFEQRLKERNTWQGKLFQSN